MINIDYNYLPTILPDVRRRTSVRYEWLRLALRGIKSGINDFKVDYNRFKFLAAHNYQTISIVDLINREFNLTSDAYIIDGAFQEIVYIGLRGESFLEPTYIYNRSEGIQETYIYNRSEESNNLDFVIIIDPSDIGFKDAIVKLVSGFAQGGKKFDVQTA